MKPLRSLRASDVMTRRIFAIPSRTTVKDAAQMLLRRRFSGAPVIDETRNCIGVVSLRDIAEYEQSRSEIRVHEHDFYASTSLDGLEGASLEFVVRRDPAVLVEQIMNPVVLAVDEDAPLSEVIRLILHHQVHRIFVMDDDRHLVGLVSTIDVMGAILPYVEAPTPPKSPVEPRATSAKPRSPARRRRP